MPIGIDILENDIITDYPEVLNILLCDRTTKKNILWGTDIYDHLGEPYNVNSNISADLISGMNGNVIMPRVNKEKNDQMLRSKEMAEVFTPSWMCNAQINLVDNDWFCGKNVFNEESDNKVGRKTWHTIKEKIKFPKNKSWLDYISDVRLEVSCGEAPYIVSRYDTTTGEFIAIEDRIGMLDRKLRVINENVDISEEWLKMAHIAYKSIYAFEWQGDSLLLAREAMFLTFVEYYTNKFQSPPHLEAIQDIANIISWNIWQMDGLKGVIPNSCFDTIEHHKDLFGDSEKNVVKCRGCNSDNIKSHNGIYCNIMDWEKKNNRTGKLGSPIRFVDLFNK